jgi:hypothetical protein
MWRGRGSLCRLLCAGHPSNNQLISNRLRDAALIGQPPKTPSRQSVSNVHQQLSVYFIWDERSSVSCRTHCCAVNANAAVAVSSACYSGRPALRMPSKYLSRAFCVYPNRSAMVVIEQSGSIANIRRMTTLASSSFPVSPRLAASARNAGA